MALQGLVVRWFGEKKFGFISYEHGGQQLEAFFSRRSVCADWKGSRAWATENAAVVFDLDGKQTEGQKRPAATNVTQCFVDNEEHESLETYREVSRVVDFNPQNGLGFLLRDCGDRLPFHEKKILDRTLARREPVKVGDFIYHGVERDNVGWQAHQIELYSPDEQNRIQLGLSLEEPVPEPKSELLSCELKRLSLMEIIRRGNSRYR